jgi:hypothetical protein
MMLHSIETTRLLPGPPGRAPHYWGEDATHQAGLEYGDRIAGWTALAEAATEFAEIVAQLDHQPFPRP